MLCISFDFYHDNPKEMLALIRKLHSNLSFLTPYMHNSTP